MKSKNSQTQDYIKLLPIGLILAIVPIIVYMKIVDLNESISKYWNGSKQYYDFFSYYKMVWFITFTIIAVVFFLFYLSTKKIKFSFPKIFIPLSLYAVFVFLSASFSKYHYPSFFGFADRFEGLFTIICYILICFVSYALISSKNDYKYLFGFLVFSVIIVGFIGLTQFFGFDILQSDFGKKMMLPAENQNIASALKFNFPEKYIYSTLYNPNYVGGFFGIILPIVLVLFILVEKTSKKLLIGLLCLLVFSNLIGSLSSTGLFGAVVSGIALLVLLRRYLRKNLIPIAALTLCFCFITVSMNIFSDGAVFKQLNLPNVSYTSIKNNLQAFMETRVESNSRFLNLTFTNVSYKNTSEVSLKATNVVTKTTPEKLYDIQINKNKLFLYLSASDALIATYDASTGGLSFTDLSNNSLETEASNKDGKKVITFIESKYSSITITLENTVLTIQAPYCTFNLVVTADGLKFLTPSGQMTDIIKAEYIGFEGRETWASSRGYIWSRSLPLLKNTILLGNGPDTFAIYFPQNDYVAKLHYLDNINIIVDKPHNTYLQIALNTGILSLLAFLAFIGWYLGSSFKLYFKNKNNNDFFTPGVACLLSIVAFLITSLTNDSTVSVSPVFWIIIGAGIACNKIYSTPIKQTKNY